MTHLVIATMVFIVTHTVPAYGPLRRLLVARLGEGGYLGLYSVLSLGMILWLGYAYVDAPYVELWVFAEWTRWVPVLVMPLACVLLVAGLASPNPLSMSANRRPFDPRRPGIVAVTRHPVMWGLALWPGSHIPPNGDAASLILFGLFLGMSLGGPVSLDHKRRAGLGEAAWRKLAAATSNFPFAAMAAGRTRTSIGDIGWPIIAGGLALYLVLLVVHEYFIGVPPLPFLSLGG